MGPLAGVKVVEIASIGPGPFAAMLLSDMGAEVFRVQRVGEVGLFGAVGTDVLGRGRASSAQIDLKDTRGREIALRLIGAADALIEGFRPGVMERLSLGPDVALARNPRLVYARVTGYGQDGPMAQQAGHDINYISIAGALGAIARRGERPLFPLNLLGDYGGGGMLLAFGIACALFEARQSGQGQVVDASMVDGASLLMSVFHGLRVGGFWTDEPGTNVLDSGAHFYEVYATADGGYIAVGAIEPKFYAALLRLLEIDAEEMPQWDRGRWPEFKARLAAVFARRTRAEWSALFDGAEACVTPVLSLAEAPNHPQNIARGGFVEYDGVVQPAPAPRFSRTPAVASEKRGSEPSTLRGWGLTEEDIEFVGLPARD